MGGGSGGWGGRFAGVVGGRSGAGVGGPGRGGCADSEYSASSGSTGTVGTCSVLWCARVLRAVKRKNVEMPLYDHEDCQESELRYHSECRGFLLQTLATAMFLAFLAFAGGSALYAYLAIDHAIFAPHHDLHCHHALVGWRVAHPAWCRVRRRAREAMRRYPRAGGSQGEKAGRHSSTMPIPQFDSWRSV